MAKRNIQLVTGEKYHVYNRGVDKRVTFQDTADYIRFYQSLAFFNTLEPTQNYRMAKGSYAPGAKQLVKIYAYALLSNHFHLLLEQVSDGGISEFMKRVSVGYTGYFNEKYQRSGVLFQGKYKKVHITSQEQDNYLFAYVNENHSVHQVMEKIEMYSSSSVHYSEKGKSKLIQFTSRTYDSQNARKLAMDIFNRRSSLKDILE